MKYLKKKRTRLPKWTPALQCLCEDWIAKRRRVLLEIREHGARAEPGQLESLISSDLDRWFVDGVGKSRVAWMERAVTFSALLLDYRSKRFGKRLKDNGRWELATVNDNQEALVSHQGESARWTHDELRQVVSAVIFASEWGDCLNRLMVCPPKAEPTPPEEADLHAEYPAFTRLLPELAHCRPCGVFFSRMLNDPWSTAGGRDECRRKLICPHCYARNATRLVERVEQGPWKESRRAGRQLVMIRVSVSTSDLSLDRNVQEGERTALGFSDWLAPGLPQYTGDAGNETMILNIDANQSIDDTLTPHELGVASDLLAQLTKQCRACGMEGGLRFHQIGPRHRRFLHELSVVGEIRTRNRTRIMQAFCDESGQDNGFHGHRAECIILPPAYADSARVLLAGTSWGFDLSRVGAVLNDQARERSFWTGHDWLEATPFPAGLRGALAWQPIFLLSAAAFWSRYKVLMRGRFKSHHSFGTWKTRLRSDRSFRSTVQQKRWMENGGPLKEGWSQDVSKRLKRNINSSGVSRVALAHAANCSPSAVSRFVSEGYGSTELVERIRSALQQLCGRNHDVVDQPPAFASPQEVKRWLNVVGKDQKWLAAEIGFSVTRVSRQLSGKTVWQPKFAEVVGDTANRLARDDCDGITGEVGAQVAVSALDAHSPELGGQAGTTLVQGLSLSMPPREVNS